jgi:methylenetetrahydrofolate reductase (NADPH)
LPFAAESTPRFQDNGIAACAADLVAWGSLEMSADRPGDARAIAALLPVGTRVYVNHLPRHALSETLSAVAALHEAGLEPVPHLAARRLSSRAELRSFLGQAVRAAGVSKVLVIGGDEPLPQGPYEDGAGLLRDGVLAECGVREVGLPGYPEGHPRIPQAALRRALQEKLALAADYGLGAYLVTQFSFTPARIVEYCSELAREAPAVPVYIGLAGPTEPRMLLRFAQRCGVSASLRALQDQGIAAVRLVVHTDPGKQLTAVARYCLAHASCNVVGAHVFCFGAAVRAAEWMGGIIASRRAAP